MDFLINLNGNQVTKNSIMVSKVSILLLVMFSLNASDQEFNFGAEKTGQDWRIINDGVMGGLSQSTARLTKNTLQFEGTVSLENNGGFASLRSPFQKFNLTKVKDIEIRYKSKGEVAAITLENSQQFYQPYYKFYLEDTKGEWKVQKIKMSEFKELQLGRPTNRALSKEFLRSVIRIGFTVSNKRAGNFEIEVDYLIF